MTVKDAFKRLLKLYGLDSPIWGSGKERWLPEEDWDQFLDFKHWLHGISDLNMELHYGRRWGWHPSLPKDIDEATVLTPFQEREFFRRLGDCKPKTNPSGVV